MIRGLRTITAWGLALALAAAMASVTYGAPYDPNQPPIKLVVNGEELSGLPMPPVIVNDYALVPAREVFEKVGATVDWKPETQEIYVGYGVRLLVMQINNATANVDGVQMGMSVTPLILNGKTMIPLRFVSESFGFDVGWDAAGRVASVDSSGHAADLVGLDMAVLNQLANDNAARQETPSIPQTPAPTPSSHETTDLPQTPSSGQAAAVAAVDASTDPLASVSAPETQLTGLTMPESGSGGYTIVAASQIGKVEKMLLPDNRLVLDFHGALMSLPKVEYTVDSGSVKTIRAAQNQTSPTNITRVVFDLKDGVTFKVSMAPDRKSVTVSFEKNVVKGVALSSDGITDTLTLTFAAAPAASIYPATGPDRLMVDIENGELAASVASQSGRFVSALKAVTEEAGVVRLELDLRDTAMFKATTSGNVMAITISEPTFKNIRYDTASRTIIIAKAGGVSLNTNQWAAIDQYNNLMYTIYLPGDYSGLLGYGEYILNDAYVRSVDIQTSGGQTSLRIREGRVLAYDMTEDNQNIYIRAILPKQKYDKIVILDAGHGGVDQGTSGNGLLEKDVNFDVVNRAAALLEAEGSVKVYLTRTTDFKVPLEDRPAFANDIGDLFISVHCNSGDKNTAANGTETYYYPHDNDAALGFSAKQTATVVQNNMLAALGSADRKVQESKLYVCRYTKIPSCLVELGFISNPEEAARLATDSYRQKAAEAVYISVLQIFQQYRPSRN